MTCEKLKIKIFRDIIKVNIGAKGCDYDEPRQPRQLPLLGENSNRGRERGGRWGDSAGEGSVLTEAATAQPAVAQCCCCLRGKLPIVAVAVDGVCHVSAN